MVFTKNMITWCLLPVTPLSLLPIACAEGAQLCGFFGSREIQIFGSREIQTFGSQEIQIFEAGTSKFGEVGKIQIWGSRETHIWGNPEFWNLEIQKCGVQKIKLIKVLKIQIHSAQNVGKVWISRKKSSWPYLGPSEAIFSMDRKKKIKKAKCIFVCLFSLVGQWALFTRFGVMCWCHSQA